MVRSLSLGLLATVAAANIVSITAPFDAPAAASTPVDAAFLGIMVESTSWPWYAVRDWSQTLIQHILDRTGEMIIRVGGTSGDHAFLDANQTLAVVRDDPNDKTLTANVTFGRQWLDGFTALPASVRYVLEVPLARRPMSKTVQIAVDATPFIKNLEAIEIGNEPDLFTSKANTQAPKPYTQSSYANDFLAYTAAIKAKLPNVKYQAGGMADQSQWSAQSVYNASLSKSDLIETFAMHYYEGQLTRTPTLRGSFLNHTAVRERLSRLSDDITYIRSKNIPFVIEELGSALGGSGGDYESGIDASLGSALWSIDVMLLSQALNVTRVNMNQCNGCNFASWWVGNPANGAPGSVRAQYYALLFAADWLKAGMRVQSLFDGETHPKVSPYAGYVNGLLDRYAVLDLNESNATDARVERTFELGVPAYVKSAEIRRLTGGGTSQNATYLGAANMTYAGFTYSSAEPQGVSAGDGPVDINAVNGTVSFQLKASEAVLVILKR